MGISIVRVGDMSTGHQKCFPPRPAAAGSADVFFNGRAVHRVSDPWIEHTCENETHGGVSAGGSSNIFVNGISLVRTADPISCGDTAGEGSPDSFGG
jgi:uncharacterized Zn-binding protein involved in type VI secretion